MHEASAYCEALVRNADRDRYLTALFASAERRQPLFALYAFYIEIGRVRDLAREPMPGEIRLQWWREVLGGERDGEAEANPVASALLAAVSRYDLPREAFLNLIEARSFDLYTDPMGTLEELEAYARNTAGALIRLAARILSDAPLDDVAAQAGSAQELTRLMLTLPLHLSRGQLYLPLDLMMRHGARQEDALSGKVTPELRAVLADLRQRARIHLANAASLIVPPAALPALLPVALTRPLLHLLERNGDPLDPPQMMQWRRQWRIWRASRDPSRLF